MIASVRPATSIKKLPAIEPLYWVMIISANTIGESGGDLISMSLNLGYAAATVALVSLFIVAMLIAMWTRVQHPSIYWVTIILSSTAGTTMSDLITRQLGFGYGGGTLVILAAMTVVFVTWRLITPRHSVEDPLTPTTEFLYWCAILCSSTLGTAFGDYISNGTALGFGGGTIVLILVLAVLAAITAVTNVSRDLLYWLGIVVTHPLGATMGDYATKEEGLNFGNLKATIILAGVFFTIVAFKVVRSFGAEDAPELVERS